MAFDAHKNLAISSVAVAPSPATTGTTLSVPAGEGARFATPPFNATVWPKEMPSPLNAEIVRVTAIVGDQLTITRHEENTTVRAIVVGDLIVATVTVKMLLDIEMATVKTFRQGHTWGLVGDVSGITTLPSMFIPLVGAQTTKIVGARARIQSGTSVGVSLLINGVAQGSITVTTTPATTAINLPLANDDEVRLQLSSPVGNPTTLSVTLLLEHVVP